MEVTVRGATLAGMAASARLARLGHRVTLVTDAAPMAGRWAPGEGPGGHVVDAMPQVIRLPALWRDLFKKSGGHLQTELNRHGLELVAAPPAVHRFSDGTELTLSTDRGELFRDVERLFGPGVARRWRSLCAELVDVWAAYRRHALEGVEPVTTRAQRKSLWLDRTLRGVAAGLGGMSGIVTDLDEFPASPGLAAVTLHVDQLFGRWQLVDAHGVPQRASLLVDLLETRMLERGVTVLAGGTDRADIDCMPHLPRNSWFRPRLRPAPAPSVTHELRSETPDSPGIVEIVDHTDLRPVVSWQRRVADGVLVTTHDHRSPVRDAHWGAGSWGWREWLRRPPVKGPDGSLRASATSPAGAEPWQELGSAALAVYELHERLTGEDCRPTNKDFKPPRL